MKMKISEMMAVTMVMAVRVGRSFRPLVSLFRRAVCQRLPGGDWAGPFF